MLNRQAREGVLAAFTGQTEMRGAASSLLVLVLALAHGVAAQQYGQYPPRPRPEYRDVGRQENGK